MNLERILKLALIFQWVFIISATIVSFIEEQYLPPNLAAYVAIQDEHELTSIDIFMFVIGLGFLIVYLVSSIGLARKKDWARITYLIANIALYLFSPLFGIVIEMPFSSTLGDLSTLLIGFTICLIYYSPLKEKFISTRNSYVCTS